MHGVIKQLIVVMQQASSGVFEMHDGSRVAFKQVRAIEGDDNVITYEDEAGEKQQTRLGLLVGIEVK